MNLNELNLNGTQLFHYQAMKKSKVIAYLLGAILGSVGCHRLYCKEYTGFALYLATFFLSMVIPFLYIPLGIALLVDFFYTWKLVDDYNKMVLMFVKGD